MLRFAARVIAPLPVAVKLAFTSKLLLATKPKLTLVFPVAVVRLKSLAIVILPLACSVISLPLPTPAKLPPADTLNTLSTPTSSAKASVLSVPAVNPVVLVSGAVLNTILLGSNSKLPPTPYAAPKSTFPKKLSSRLPETSIKPPLPPFAPPLEDILP